MQKVLTFFLLIIGFNSYSQQTFNAGFTGGLVTSQIYGDGYMGFNKAGLKGGLFIETKLKNDAIGSFEIIYIQKGSNRPANPSKGVHTSNTIKTNYIEVPIAVKKQYGKFLYEGGLSMGKLLSQKFYNEAGEYNSRPLFGSFELGYLLGITYPLTDKLETNIRYSNTIYAKAKGSTFVDYGFFSKLSVLKSPTHILLTFGIHYKLFKNE